MGEDKKIAIHLRNLNKTFRIREKSRNSIRELVKNLASDKNAWREIKAVSDVNLKVFHGDFLGIVGHNGSGKSTLLKLIMGAIKPDKGSHIETNGVLLRLALGMGFDPNLSARHNIYINGSIMGLTFREIGRKFHAILGFAELEGFVDTPIKYFSSGMVSRLAFSIAVHVKADILLIDEFFGGVGDESFRQKSSDIFHERILQGKTVVFVSHEMSLIRKHCNKVCIMEGGRLTDVGDPEEIIPQYLNYYQNTSVPNA